MEANGFQVGRLTLFYADVGYSSSVVSYPLFSISGFHPSQE